MFVISIEFSPPFTFINDLMSDGDEIILTGHSLGGAIARCVSSQLNLPSVTFNAAAPPSNPVFNSSLETSYHIVYDIVSAWQEPDIIRRLIKITNLGNQNYHSLGKQSLG